MSVAIVCKSQSEIEKMRRSGRIVRQVLDEMRAMVAPGVSTMDLEKAAEKKIKGNKAEVLKKLVRWQGQENVYGNRGDFLYLGEGAPIG